MAAKCFKIKVWYEDQDEPVVIAIDKNDIIKTAQDAIDPKNPHSLTFPAGEVDGKIITRSHHRSSPREGAEFFPIVKTEILTDTAVSVELAPQVRSLNARPPVPAPDQPAGK